MPRRTPSNIVAPVAAVGYPDDTYNATLGTGQLNDAVATTTWDLGANYAVVGWANVDGSLIVTPQAGRTVNAVRISMMPTYAGGITTPARIDVLNNSTGVRLGTVTPSGSGTRTVWIVIPLSTPTSASLRINVIRAGEWTMIDEVSLQ